MLAHQILALSIQEGGIRRYRVLDWLSRATPFQDLTEGVVQQLIDTMLDRGILHEDGGKLTLGLKGEKRYGARNFFELYAVFSAPANVAVLHGKEDVGTVDAQFVRAHEWDQGPLRFRLAGRSWLAKHYDERRGRLFVEPTTKSAKAARWMGNAGTLSFRLCREMKRTLHQSVPEEDGWLSKAALAELNLMRETHDGLVEPYATSLEEREQGVQWHTFAGGRINRVLGEALRQLTGEPWRLGNLSLRCKDVGRAAASEAIAQLSELDLDAMVMGVADKYWRGQLSKFQPCMPDVAVERMLRERLLDVPGAQRVAAEPVVVVSG